MTAPFIALMMSMFGFFYTSQSISAQPPHPAYQFVLDRESEIETFENLFTLITDPAKRQAWEKTSKSQLPQFILIRGQENSGKSVFARALATSAKSRGIQRVTLYENELSVLNMKSTIQDILNVVQGDEISYADEPAVLIFDLPYTAWAGHKIQDGMIALLKLKKSIATNFRNTLFIFTARTTKECEELQQFELKQLAAKGGISSGQVSILALRPFFLVPNFFSEFDSVIPFSKLEWNDNAELRRFAKFMAHKRWEAGMTPKELRDEFRTKNISESILIEKVIEILAADATGKIITRDQVKKALETWETQPLQSSAPLQTQQTPPPTSETVIENGEEVTYLRSSEDASGSGLQDVVQSSLRQPIKIVKSKVRFKDVAGQEEAIEELTDIVQLLKDYNSLNAYGIEPLKGVLLHGQPGTGKTLLAKALAGEAGVNFVGLSGADIKNPFTGVAEKLIKRYFKIARENAPCILFIDEVDSIARSRSSLSATFEGSTSIINQLLNEMDGISENNGVLVVVASNFDSSLDEAFLRPGRIDRKIHVKTPSEAGRKSLFELYTRNKRLKPDFQWNSIVKSSSGYTGADIKTICNDAAMIARKRSVAGMITEEDFEQAMERMEMGIRGGRDKELSENSEIRRQTIIHELGHTVAALAIGAPLEIEKVSVMSNGRVGGFNRFHMRPEFATIPNKVDLIKWVIIGFGGRAAEELLLNQVTRGPASDLQTIKSTISEMYYNYGMSDTLGPIRVEDPSGLSPETRRELELEMKATLQKAENKAREAVEANRQFIQVASEALEQKRVLNHEEIMALWKAHGKSIAFD